MDDDDDTTKPKVLRKAVSARAVANAGAMANLNEEEMENMMDTFADSDEFRSKTYTRLFVENVLMKRNWYNPSQIIKNGPSLSKAYAFYEHITLPRHFVSRTTNLRRCEPGETEPTELYHPFTTPSSSFIEWGIGVDLYFSTVRLMTVVLFVAGLILLPNILFFASTDYSPEGHDDLSLLLKGSAICTSKEYVRCDDCEAQYKRDEESDRFLMTTDGFFLALRNNCSLDWQVGLWHCLALLFLVIVVILTSFYLRAREVRFDEDKLTATDYSLVVKNPPPDAYDPDEWRDFFGQFAEKQVVMVTIALNNEELVRKLMYRRSHRRNLKAMLPNTKGIDMENEDEVRAAVSEFVHERDSYPRGCLYKLFSCTLLPLLRVFSIGLPAETLVDRVFALTDEIQELQNEKYDVVKVFVTFETEEGQRTALQSLSVGRVFSALGRTHNIPSNVLFKGKLLRVEEPAEPSAVRWLDLSASAFRKIFWRTLNVTITLAVVAVAGLVSFQVRNSLGPWFSGIVITAFNTIIPLIVKILMIFEPHSSFGSYQAALYLKITLFRWVNTTVLINALTPFTSRIDDDPSDVIPQIRGLFVSELWLAPTLKLLDIWGNFRKHVLAPRAITQEQMNLNFTGTGYNLGERYTDLTKVLFMCFFFSAVFPASFFFGTAILILQYYSDKYCLMRIWGYTPFIGSEVAKFSRKYFFTGAILVCGIVSAYTFAGFPYDNICRDDDNFRLFGARGNYTVVGKSEPVEVVKDEHYLFCKQGAEGYRYSLFPPSPEQQPDDRKWMSSDQEGIVTTYGTIASLMAIFFVVAFLGGTAVQFVCSWFRGVHKESGQMQHIDYSSNLEISAYVPQVSVGGFQFPLLVCDIDQVDQDLIGWNDPNNSYDFHNMIFDVEWKGMPRKKRIKGNTRDISMIDQHEDYQEASIHNADARPIQEVKPIFAKIKHYPPPWKTKLREMEAAQRESTKSRQSVNSGSDV